MAPRQYNQCAWLVVGRTETCDRSCVGEFCKVHNARIRVGGGTYACQLCGVGVRTSLSLCRPCGADTVYRRQKRAAGYLFRAEWRRLAGIDLS